MATLGLKKFKRSNLIWILEDWGNRIWTKKIEFSGKGLIWAWGLYLD